MTLGFQKSTFSSVRCVMALIGLFVSSKAHAGITINLTLTGSGLTQSQSDAFFAAKAFWESRLVGYQPGISLTGVDIAGSSALIDGPGGTIGQAAPQVTTTQAGYLLTVSGTMAFDTEDLAFLEANNVLANVLTHEMGHVLGYGFHWTANNVYNFGSGQYTGARGLAEYRNEFAGQSNVLFVPVELGGGSGTANFHWDEVDFGAGLTGRVTTYGRDMRDELMTGWFNRTLPAFVSRTTLGQFEDLGFVADFGAIPEPSSGLAALSGIIWLSLRRRRSP